MVWRFVGSTVLLVGSVANANWLDDIRNTDLNNYAVGAALANSQNPYVGASNVAYFYPYLTSFEDSALNDNWLLIRDSAVGLRSVKGAWEIGLLARINTSGTGDSDSPALAGLSERRWSLEAAPMIGYRGLPVHINFKTFAEVSGRHGGLTSLLTFSLPLQWSRGYLVPGVEVIHQDKDYLEYYFGVSASESNPMRAAYSPNSATGSKFRLRWGYAISPKWLMSGLLSYELLADEATDSPIVARDSIWSATLGLSYNSDLFRAKSRDRIRSGHRGIDIRIGYFSDHIDTTMTLDTTDGRAGSRVDFEDLLGLSEKENIVQVDALWRINNFNRLELGYFGLERDSTTVLAEDLDFGDERFVAGTSVDTRLSSHIAQLSYGYSILNDAQKELGISAGIHFSKIEAELSALATEQRMRLSSSTPLPVVGVYASVNVTTNVSLKARVQAFRMDFDTYAGSLNTAAIELQYHIGERLILGLAYNYFSMNLRTNESAASGRIGVRHQGPALLVGVSF